MAWPGRRDGWRLRLVRARAAAFEGRGRLAGWQAGTAMERQSQPRRPIDERPAGRVERERHASLFRRLRVDRLAVHPLLSLVGGVGCFLFPVTLLSPQSLMSHYLSAPVVRRRHPLRRSISQSHGLRPVPQDKFPSRSAGVHRHSKPAPADTNASFGSALPSQSRRAIMMRAREAKPKALRPSRNAMRKRGWTCAQEHYLLPKCLCDGPFLAACLALGTASQ